MDIEIAKEKLKVIDIKFFLNGMIEQSNYIIDKADEINIAIETVLSELEKKDKEYEELTEASKELCKTVNLMKKVINEMAKHIHLSGDYECLNKECEDDGNIDCEECIKEYFTKKAEKEGK